VPDPSRTSGVVRTGSSQGARGSPNARPAAPTQRGLPARPDRGNQHRARRPSPAVSTGPAVADWPGCRPGRGRRPGQRWMTGPGADRARVDRRRCAGLAWPQARSCQPVVLTQGGDADPWRTVRGSARRWTGHRSLSPLATRPWHCRVERGATALFGWATASRQPHTVSPTPVRRRDWRWPLSVLRAGGGVGGRCGTLLVAALESADRAPDLGDARRRPDRVY
jgi:hypothetical protein